MKQVTRIISIGKNEIWLIITYGIIISILSLILPIAAQALVTLVTFGSISQPLFFLVLSVFVVLSTGAFFRIIQIILIENIQQRIFTHISLSLAKLIPQWRVSVFDQYRGTEAINRYFDIFTIQKSIASLLLSGIGVFLQALFGMVLLATYHPYLLIYDIILIIAITCVIVIPWKSALQSAFSESYAKYEVAGWLEELSRIQLLFKFSNNRHYAYSVADNKISDYLSARQNHFSNLLTHIIGAHSIQVIASSGLLLLGGILIIKNQLTIGQLVAAEIVINAIGSSMNKFGKYLENIYDLFAASDKVNFLLDQPTEPTSEGKPTLAELTQPPDIEVKDIEFTSQKNYPILSGISFSVKANDKLVIHGQRGAGKSILVEIMLGLREASKGEILYNGIPITEYSLLSLRDKIAYIKGIQFFDGSIYDNLVMGRPEITVEQVRESLLQFDLSDTVSRLPQGLHTELYGNQQLLSSMELQKLMFVRAALTNPILLVIDEALDIMSEASLKIIMQTLLNQSTNKTIIATTRRHDIAEAFHHKVIL